MLASQPASLAEIGATVGYESEAALSRAFERVSGLSLAAWRAQTALSPMVKPLQ